MNNNLMFSSANQNWATRWEHFNQIQDYFDVEFNLDPCAEAETAKCDTFFTKEQDMFSIEDWSKAEGLYDKYPEVSVFMNPPYGREQPKFVEELVKRIKSEQVWESAILVPARTDTKLFHDIILPNATEIVFYQGRLVFGTDAYWEFVWSQEIMDLISPKDAGKKNPMFNKIGKFNSAPFCSMVVHMTQDSVENKNNKPIISTLKAAKAVYSKT